MLPQEIFREIRCSSEIVSGAIFGRKQCRGSYYVFHPILAVLHAFAKPADFIILRDKVLSTKFGRTVGGVTSIGQLNSRS